MTNGMTCHKVARLLNHRAQGDGLQTRQPSANLNVRHTDFQTGSQSLNRVENHCYPSHFIRVAALRSENHAEVDGVRVLLARRNGKIHAMVETCAHMGGPLAEGTLIDGGVRCPWHGSGYALEDGRAPGEPDLMIATRMRDTAFKRVLKTKPLGTEVRIVGPFGSLTLRQNAARPAVFLTRWHRNYAFPQHAPASGGTEVASSYISLLFQPSSRR